MATVKKNVFEVLYQGSVVEYEGENLYNFYNIDEDFFFTYNVEDNQFTDKCDMNLSPSQLNKVSVKIIDFHSNRIWQDTPSYESQDDLEVYGEYELYNPRA